MVMKINTEGIVKFKKALVKCPVCNGHSIMRDDHMGTYYISCCKRNCGFKAEYDYYIQEKVK
jgi:hypothetical protein